MQLINMFQDQIEDAIARKVPFVLPIGTVEYHARHNSCGVDTMVITGCLRELEKEKEIVVCPPIWYGVGSYAVCDATPGHFHVEEDAYTDYIYHVLKSMMYAGNNNVYLMVHHQTENEGLMPMTIACHKAAKKITMEYMEEKNGKGWWGSNSFKQYYENVGTGDDPFSYFKVLSLMGVESQKTCGFDHAGKWETSLMMSLYPENVDLQRCKQNTEWFAESAVHSSVETGDEMVKQILKRLREVIV